MNPLPNRPLVTSASIPLSLPNVPPLDQAGFNGRPRKTIPEVGKDFPLLNGANNVPPSSQTVPQDVQPSSSQGSLNGNGPPITLPSIGAPQGFQIVPIYPTPPQSLPPSAPPPRVESDRPPEWQLEESAFPPPTEERIPRDTEEDIALLSVKQDDEEEAETEEESSGGKVWKPRRNLRKWAHYIFYERTSLTPHSSQPPRRCSSACLPPERAMPRYRRR
jgi:striatin 1/3/4